MRAETTTAGRAIVDVLRAERVRHVFGLPGGHVLGIYDAPEIRYPQEMIDAHRKAPAPDAA